MLCTAWASRDLEQLTQLYSSSIVVLAIGHAINEWIVALVTLPITMVTPYHR